MQTSAEALKDWMNYKYDLQPGIISVLHTAGEQKEPHFHTHMILSWGGINKSRTVEQIKGIYVNYDYLKAKFRGIFEKRLCDFFDTGKLDHDFKNIIEFKRFIKRVNGKNWIIHFEAPMDTPSDVIRYIGRYSKRACLSERKITLMENELIAFKYKDNKNKDINGKPIEKELVLNYRDFFALLLQHVPLPYFRLVRYYGIYSNRGRLPKEYFNCDESTPLNWAAIHEAETGQDPLVCPVCKISKIYIDSFVETKTGTNKYLNPLLIHDSNLPFKDRAA
jgi:hypothetical protein